MKQVIYWDVVIGNNEIFSPYISTIWKLLIGEYKSLNLEKIEKANSDKKFILYSIRINRENRIIFTSQERTVYLLDLLLEHTYQKCAYIENSNLVQPYIDNINLEQLIVEKLSFPSNPRLANNSRPKFFAVSAGEIMSEVEYDRKDIDQTDEVNFTPVQYYNHQIIQLDDEQKSVVSLKKFPAIVYGSAGSGKNAAALYFLKKFINEQLEGVPSSDKRVVYVSQNPNLVEQMREHLQALIQDERLSELVQFKTYDQILKDLYGDTIQLADKKHFIDWYNTTSRKQDDSSDEIVWQELRIRSGYAQDGDYLSLGERQSSLQVSNRNLICTLYNRYLSRLTSESRISPCLTRLLPLPTPPYQLMLVDESQDLSYGQLDNLLHLCSQIVYLVGDHQTLWDGKSRTPFLKQLLYREFNETTEVITLKGNYRCAPAIISVANKLIQLKLNVSGGAADRNECAEIVGAPNQTNDGEAYWIDTYNSEQLLEVIAEASETHNLAIITDNNEEHIKEAKSTFKTTTLHFTPEQIKGLEFDTIILWKPLENPMAAMASPKLTDHIPSTNLPLPDRGDDCYRPFFNSLITSVTRARHKLILVQERQHKTRDFYDKFKAAFQKETSTVLQSTETPTTREDWLRTAERLFANKNLQQAIDTLRDKCCFSDPAIQDWLLDKNFNTENDTFFEKEQIASPSQAKKKKKKKKKARSLDQEVLQQSMLDTNLIENEDKLIQLKNNFFEYNSIQGSQKCTLNKTLQSKQGEVLVAFLLQKKEDVEKLLKFRETNPTRFKILPWKNLLTAKQPAPSFIYKLCQYEAGITLFYHLLNDLYPTLNQKQLSEFATSLFAVDEKTKLSTLNLLTQFPSEINNAGKDALVILFDKINWDLDANSQRNWGLALAHSIPTGPNANYSPLLWLSNFTRYKPLLHSFLVKYPAILNAIPHEIWGLPHTTAGGKANSSPIYMLTTNKDGLKIISWLLENYPEVIDGIPAEIWGRALTDAANSYANITPLYMLTTSPEGRMVLASLVDKHPKIIEGIPHMAWGMNLSGTHSHFSPLFWLAGNPDGRKILISIVDKYPNIIKGIPFEAWGRTCSVGTDTNTTPIFWLTTGNIGLKILSSLIEKFPEIINNIPEETWGRARTEAAGLNANYSPLYLLTTTSTGRQLLAMLIDKYPNIIEGIPHKAWTLNLTGDRAYMSPLYWLAAYPDGRKILITLVDKYPNIIKSIPHEAWITVCPKEPNANTTPIYWLTTSNDGLKVLSLLIEKFPEIVNSIPAGIWGQALTEAAGSIANISPIYWLTTSNDGLSILTSLLEKFPEIINNIPAEAWGRARTEAAGLEANISPIYWLTMTNDGLSVLTSLLEKFPEVINNIPAETWGRARTEAAGLEVNFSPIYWLTKTLSGRQLLAMLIDKYPQIIEGIPHKTWALNLTGDNAYISPLYLLAGYPDGRKILISLVDKHPNIIKSIPPEKWGIACTTEPDINATPIYWLTTTNDGLKVLSSLLEKFPEIINDIPAVTWKLALPKTADSCANLSPIYMLSTTVLGLKILAYLVNKHPNIIEGSPNETSSLALTKEGDNTSALFWLTAYRPGQELLKFILDKHPNIINSIPHETWYRISEDGYSPIFNLTRTPQGREILMFLIDNHFEIIKDIPPEVWCLPLPESVGALANISPLYWLIASLDGLEIIKYLIDNHPEIITAFPPKAWEQAPTEAENYTPIYYLTSNVEPLQILNSLFKINPELINGIRPEIWGLTITNAEGKENDDTNTSPLYWLTVCPEGREFLAFLVEKNPAIVDAIHPETWALALTEATTDYANSSPIYWLTKDDYGLTTLKFLVDERPKIIEDIPAEVWGRTGPKADNGGCGSALRFLAETTIGLQIINSLLEAPTNILEAIPDETWTREYESLSILSILSAHSDGIKTLEKLYKKLTPDKDLALKIKVILDKEIDQTSAYNPSFFASNQQICDSTAGPTHENMLMSVIPEFSAT